MAGIVYVGFEHPDGRAHSRAYGPFVGVRINANFELVATKQGDHGLEDEDIAYLDSSTGLWRVVGSGGRGYSDIVIGPGPHVPKYSWRG